MGLLDDAAALIAAVEIHVTHPVDDAKKEDIADMPWIEVDADAVLRDPIHIRVRRSGGPWKQRQCGVCLQRGEYASDMYDYGIGEAGAGRALWRPVTEDRDLRRWVRCPDAGEKPIWPDRRCPRCPFALMVAKCHSWYQDRETVWPTRFESVLCSHPGPNAPPQQRRDRKVAVWTDAWVEALGGPDGTVVRIRPEHVRALKRAEARRGQPE